MKDGGGRGEGRKEKEKEDRGWEKGKEEIKGCGGVWVCDWGWANEEFPSSS